MTAPRHVLVVAYDFPPHAAIGTQRTLRLVRYLADQSWRVTVLTSDPHTYRSTTPVDEALLSRVPQHVRVIRAPAWRLAQLGLRQTRRPSRDPGRGAPTAPDAGSRAAIPPTPRSTLRQLVRAIAASSRIPDTENGWIVPAILRVLWTLRGPARPDVIFSSAPPWSGQVVARALRAAWRVPWVADFRDPWARAPWREDRPRVVMRAADMLERWVVSGTDRVVFVSEANAQDFRRHYGDPLAARFHVVPNGCDPDEFDGLTTRSRPHTFVLLHAGSLYGGRSPVPLMRAIARGIARGVLDPSAFRFRQVGPCGRNGEAMLFERERLRLTEVVELVPRLDRQESLREVISANALLLLQPGTTVAVPAKLYEYFAAKRPILAVTEEGETAHIVRQSGVGIVCPPGNEDAILEGLLAVIDRARSPLTPAARSMYDGRMHAAALADLLMTVSEGRALLPQELGRGAGP